jgi:hypothetical protein
VSVDRHEYRSGQGTGTTPEQKAILRQLGLMKLVDDEGVAEQIRPR